MWEQVRWPTRLYPCWVGWRGLTWSRGSLDITPRRYALGAGGGIGGAWATALGANMECHVFEHRVRRGGLAGEHGSLRCRPAARHLSPFNLGTSILRLKRHRMIAPRLVFGRSHRDMHEYR